MNAVMNMVGAKSYASSFKRFTETGSVYIEETEAVRVKMEIPRTDSDNEVFVVEDIYNPYVYLLAYADGKYTEITSVLEDNQRKLLDSFITANSEMDARMEFLSYQQGLKDMFNLIMSLMDTHGFADGHQS